MVGSATVMHQAAVGVDTDVPLHAEVPLFAFSGLVHFRIAFPIGILGRIGRRDDRRINDAATLEQQPFAVEMSVDLLENVLGQVVLFQKVPEVEDRRFIGDCLAQFQACEAAQRRYLAQRFFDRRVA